MSEGELFPNLHDGSSREEPWDHRFAPLARILHGTEHEVATAFFGLDTPEYATRAHLDAVKASMERLNRTLQPANRLLYHMRQLSDEELGALRACGSVTVEQIEHWVDVLGGEAEGLKGWYSTKNRRGGRNVAAYTVAEGVRRAFRRRRARITYGEAGGRPTTDFGRAVEQSIAAFGIRADWSDPAHDAFQRQRAYELRLGRREISRQRRANGLP